MIDWKRNGPSMTSKPYRHSWEDMSEADTAKMLGCSVGTVKSQAARGLARLRERMGPSARTASSRG